MSAETFDCTSCGACCQHAGEVTVTEEDATPRYLTRSVRGMMGFASYEAWYLRRMARDEADRCVSLKGDVGGCCGCKIYDRRPNVCREFEAGTKACLASRALAGPTSPNVRTHADGGEG